MLRGLGRIIVVLWAALFVVAWCYTRQSENYLERLHQFADLALLWVSPWLIYSAVKAAIGWIRDGFSKKSEEPPL